MNQLRIRLEQTEAQLTRILAAMEQIDVNPNLETCDVPVGNDNLNVDNGDIPEKASDYFEDCTENLGNFVTYYLIHISKNNRERFEQEIN